MKKQYNNTFLMIILFLLSASIGILHGRKKGIDPAMAEGDMRLVLEKQDAIDYVQPYLMSDNIDAAAAILAEFADSLFLKTINTILQNKTVQLSDEQKVQLLAALFGYTKEKKKQKIVMDKLRRHFDRYPVFAAMVPYYTRMIPLIISWFTSKPGKEQVALWIQLSAHAALERNDVGMMIALYQAGMPFDTVEASPLLYRVIDENKNPDFVPFLVHYLKADSNFSPDGKRTLLIKAVEDNNMPLVHMLLEHGADPDIILDSQIGSAQQIAFERGYTPIELRLRQKR